MHLHPAPIWILCEISWILCHNILCDKNLQNAASSAPIWEFCEISANFYAISKLLCRLNLQTFIVR